MTTEELFRATVAALLRATGETQARLAEALLVTQGAVSLKQNGKSSWSLDDVDVVSRHFGIAVPDLMIGPTHALQKLPRVRMAACVGGRQEVIPV
ncbi:helix-turn-helix domain-containing protein [Kitasatospora sp. NPDC059973]|uniref:helix-turn-helix domain-containing protein n=1 Tax=Kitasatospora sp. NPDC059973 TaxID=3347020 RepID=UPI0036AE11E6